MNSKGIAGQLTLCLLAVLIVYCDAPAKMPPPMEQCAAEPVKYIGSRQTDKRFFDGALPHTVGSHHYQAFRASREHPSEPGPVGWTYNHQPYLCYWNDQFYLHYLSNFVDEHNPPGRTLLMISKDARTWSDPIVIFPIYHLPEIVIPEQIYIPEGTTSVMHQRMGFYVAPNGRLLVFGFYGFAPSTHHSPNTGNGLGRVVREVYKDGALGPIYFIRYNRHAGWNEHNTEYPFYKASNEEGFVEACEAILADKLMSLQWWEEDRAKDGFYVIDPGDVRNAFDFTVDMTTSRGAGKAFCFYRRPDGVTVGLWKNKWSALSPDGGKTWMRLAKSPTLMAIGAKTWGQRTKDDRYVLVYNHSPIRGNRFPMCVMTGDDGHEFDNLLCLQGEVPPRRYEGLHKPWGSQYIRGIMPGNGDPPGEYLWNVYSMNKEDMWITRTHLPVAASVDDYVNENFDSAKTEADLELWNLYVPKWAPISIESEPGRGTGKCLVMRDKERYDYALAERAFPESKDITIKFDVMAKQADHGRLEIDVTPYNGNNVHPVRIAFTDAGKIQAATADKTVDIGSYKANAWLSFQININTPGGNYSMKVNNKGVLKNADLAEQTDAVQRLVFRTGQYRGVVPPEKPDKSLPNAGVPVEEAEYCIDNVTINL